MKMLRCLANVAACQRGATAVEYALILGLVVLVVIGAIQLVANQTITMWNNVSTKTSTAISQQ